jgi:hypothetical protein
MTPSGLQSTGSWASFFFCPLYEERSGARTHFQAQFRFAKADNARLALDLNEPNAAQCSQPASFVESIGIRDAVDFGI